MRNSEPFLKSQADQFSGALDTVKKVMYLIMVNPRDSNACVHLGTDSFLS